MRAAGRAALLLLAVLCLAAGCSSDADQEPAEAAEAAGGPVDVAQDEPGPVAPLTGSAVGSEAEAEALLSRPVVAVKVDNAAQALPQEGIEHADIVLVSLVEGGLTRLTALFHSALPDRVGPVRSGRAGDALLLPSFDALLATSGAAQPVLRRLREAGVALREEAQPPDAWVRDPARRAPHNLFVAPAALASDAAEDSVGATAPWPIAAGAGEGEATGRVTLRYSAVSEAAWEWEGSRWVRSQGGAPHATADGARVSAANVVIARVGVRETDRTDAAGSPVVDLALEGSGDALVLRGGRAVAGRWEREPGGHFSWWAEDGERIELLPGRTWVELVPDRGRVETAASAVG